MATWVNLKWRRAGNVWHAHDVRGYYQVRRCGQVYEAFVAPADGDLVSIGTARGPLVAFDAVEVHRASVLSRLRNEAAAAKRKAAMACIACILAALVTIGGAQAQEAATAWDYRLSGVSHMRTTVDPHVGNTHVTIRGKVRKVPKWMAVELLKRELRR